MCDSRSQQCGQDYPGKMCREQAESQNRTSRRLIRKSSGAQGDHKRDTEKSRKLVSQTVGKDIYRYRQQPLMSECATNVLNEMLTLQAGSRSCCVGTTGVWTLFCSSWQWGCILLYLYPAPLRLELGIPHAQLNTTEIKATKLSSPSPRLLSPGEQGPPYLPESLLLRCWAATVALGKQLSTCPLGICSGAPAACISSTFVCFLINDSIPDMDRISDP